MATYKEIQDYIREKHGSSVKSCWIAHVKEMYGILQRIAPNRISEYKRSNPCPKNKIGLIVEALIHFQMIPPIRAEPIKRDYPLVELYRLYQVDHWIYKVNMLWRIIEDFKGTSPSLQEGLTGINDEDFLKMVKIELHVTYFQMVECIFKMIFGLEFKEDLALWEYLSDATKDKQIIKRIENIGNGRHEGLFSEVELDKGVTIPFIQYVFYFIYQRSEDFDMEANLKNIHKALIIFGKDFSDRDEYNAFKHSLRLYHTGMTIGIGSPGRNMKASMSENTLVYLKSGKKVFKAFDPETDFLKCLLCHQLISNIINTRKYYFYGIHEKWFIFENIDWTFTYPKTSITKFSVSY